MFGRDHTVRAGWLTIGPELTSSYYEKDKYKSYFEPPNSQLTGCTERIEMLRPKSPPMKIKQQQQAMYCQTQQQQQDLMPFMNVSASTAQQQQSGF